MSAPVRYQFDKVFALDAAKTPEPPKMDVIAAETQARQARQDGFEEGRAAAAADQAARAAAALEKLVAALPALQQQAEAATRRMQADACRIGHAIAVKLAGALVAREPLAGIEALLAQTLAELQGVPHLVIRVNEALADTLKEKAEAQARLSGFDGRLIVMGEPPRPVPVVRSSKLAPATIILVITLAVAATSILPTAEAMMLGALAMVLIGVLSADEAYDAIEWKSVFLVAGMLPMGLALTNTGLADLAAENLVRLVAPYGPQALLAALFLMTTLLAQVISGPAVAAIVVPLAIGSAQRLGLNPQHMALAVALATSMAFLTPLGHPVNILIMGPGGYRFTDYFKVGLPLTLVVTLVILIILPIVYPL